MPGGKSLFSGLRERLPSRERRRNKSPCSSNDGQGSHVLDLPIRAQQDHGDRVLPQQPDPAPSSEGKSVRIVGSSDQPSLWTLAYEKLQQEQPDLMQNFHDCLGISTTALAADPNGLTGLTKEALTQIANAEEARSTSRTKIQKTYRKTIEIIIASKDLITAAASASPYASLAWSGVSLLLPAKNWIPLVKDLTPLYLSKLKDLVIRLYTMIFEFQASLLVFTDKKQFRQWATAVFDSGTWSSRIAGIEKQDAQCKAIMHAVSDARAVRWQSEQREWQEELLRQPRQAEEERHLRMLYSNYEQGKNVNPMRIPGTCEWFLNHPDFLVWRKSRCSDLLWLSADPGCGKSVLTKHLVDRRGEFLTIRATSPVVCYFFFKDGDVNRMDASKAVCAMLHQLLLQRPQLYHYAQRDFETKSDSFLSDFQALWNIFINVANDSLNGEIICVLDALDECEELSRVILLDQLVNWYRHRPLNDASKPIIKIIVTSRPYYQIERRFKPLEEVAAIRLRGEDESEQVSREIDLVIDHEVERLATDMDLDQSDVVDLRRNLKSIEHRTYLWLHLVLNDIKKRLDLSKSDIAAITQSIPRDVEQAYEAILDRSPDKAKARKLLHIILAARQPLTLGEVNVALELEEKHTSFHELTIWKTEIAATRVRNICGLFVTVLDSKVSLLHQTAREYLQGEASESWQHAFSLRKSNLIMAEACIRVFLLEEIQAVGRLPQFAERGFVMRERWKLIHRLHSYSLVQYAGKYWFYHFKRSQKFATNALLETIENHTCQPSSNTFALCKLARHHWWNEHDLGFIEADIMGYDFDSTPITNLILVSRLGLASVVEYILEQGNREEDAKNSSVRSSLFIAATEGHNRVVRVLLERTDVRINSRDNHRRTPLMLAAERGNEAVARLLLDRGARINLKDSSDGTALSAAVKSGNAGLVRLLLVRNAQIDIHVSSGYTPLLLAALKSKKSVIQALLDHGAGIDNRDQDGKTPLHYAVQQQSVGLVELLLDNRAQAGMLDINGKTPLHYAAQWGKVAVARLLLDYGAQWDIQDEEDLTPLNHAKNRVLEARTRKTVWISRASKRVEPGIQVRNTELWDEKLPDEDLSGEEMSDEDLSDDELFETKQSEVDPSLYQRKVQKWEAMRKRVDAIVQLLEMYPLEHVEL
ncbi:MAG: hypothetical protein Q9222_002471 [Ikaeria aurantiellina]